MKKLRILEVCPFTSGICGVFSRVLNESLEFKKLGHEVIIFSSDVEKGTGKKVSKKDNLQEIIIRRFPSKNGRIGKLLSDNVIHWFNNEAVNEMIALKPDIIITHLLHPHSARICTNINNLKKLNPRLKTFIVPHAPFNIKRKFPLNIITSLWRKFSRLRLNKFDSVIAITKWEYPYLLSLGANREKIKYIPNGLPSKFFTQKKSEPKEGVLFLGRIAPVKNIETIIKCAKQLQRVNFTIAGFPEKRYLEHLNNISKGLKNIKIHPPVYDLSKKIKLIDSNKIFVLPSHREAMPQVLLEAMARGRIVISSDTDGGKELIDNGKNGFLFSIGKYMELCKLIELNLKGNKEVEKKAIVFSREYSWDKLIKRYEEIFK